MIYLYSAISIACQERFVIPIFLYFPSQEERERQITMVRERIARVRYERTMTMREPKDEKAQGFESLLSEEEKQGLSEEEKMKRVAAKMEEKFKSETRRVSVAVSELRTKLATTQACLWTCHLRHSGKMSAHAPQICNSSVNRFQMGTNRTSFLHLLH